MSDTLKIILWRYDSISEYHVGRIAVRKNNRRSLVEVVTTEISFNITARSRLSQDIQDTLNSAIASGLFRKYLNRYGSADFYNYGSIMTVYGVFSTTDINYNIPVRNPTPRPTMRTSTVSPTKRFIDSDYPTIRPSSPVKKTDLPPQIPIHDHSSDAESYDPMNGKK